MSFYKQFEEIKEEMKNLYLKDDCPFVLATSFGKDSTLQLLLLMETLLSIPKEQRQKKVYIISSDTMVEMESMSAYIRTSLQMVQDKANELDLPIEVRLVKPAMKERYWFNVLGKGNPPVVPKSKQFRWCTGKLKQNPIDRAIKEIQKESYVLYQEYDLYLFLGTRDSESIQRKNSIEKFSMNGSKFGRHSKYDRVCAYYPIKHVHGSALWGYLFDYEVLPWGMPLSTLESFYPEGAFECGLKTDGQQSSCGGGRNGCWTCTFVKKDTMLEDEIQKGNQAAFYLYEYKKLLMEIRNDARYREATKRIEMRKTKKRLDERNNNPFQVTIFDTNILNDIGVSEQKQHNYESFNRANDTDYSTGSLTFDCRKLLLEHLLYLEQITGLKLIEHEEIQAIIDVWREEGYNIHRVQPKEFIYDGAVVFDNKFNENMKETNNPNPQFWITREFSMGRDEVIEYITKRQKVTGKSYYYNLSHQDFGEEESFVYNTAVFLVCQAGITSEIDAGKLIDQWLYPKPIVETMDWDAFAQKYIDAAHELISRPSYDPCILNKINKILSTLGYNTIEYEEVLFNEESLVV